ncbi:hypothetical protein CR203_16235 [Salipaludibacillus neizhouensis]|uniref:Sin domain-containing protein n=1 Tax=Salipaludibacillus neizhouensis TaxID=885475 RepID=A0A3A9K280_9BACI|nr:anti-repressor SinI family protein [Salipaludibacillus neizhouensis]RKL66439.1 hypothetical protein CR203_16235 [Salipaludibacillus neizhouensis]
MKREKLQPEKQVLDHEWLRLINKAKNIGLTKDEVREFLRSKQVNYKL